MDGLKTSFNINPLLLGGIAVLALIAAIALVAYRKHYRINVFLPCWPSCFAAAPYC